MRGGEIETEDGKFKDDYFLILNGKEANEICDALREHCELNKRKRYIKKLTGQLDRFFVTGHNG